MSNRENKTVVDEYNMRALNFHIMVHIKTERKAGPGREEESRGAH